MKNLTTLKELDLEEITHLLDRAEAFKQGEKKSYANCVFANLFFEPSTRTQNSFIMAQKKLGIQDINLNPEASSIKKGETLYDTVKTFEAIGVSGVVIRASEVRYYEELVGKLNIPVLNGGDGAGDHPTQSLLDLMTIREEFGRLEGLKVLILGDIRFSRVAKTNIEVMRRLGMEVFICAPEPLKDPAYDYIDCNEAFAKVDVAMLLRVQHERHEHRMNMTQEEYLTSYGLNKTRYAEMQEHAIIMHPAPFNRGWEIDGDLVESPKSRIFKQMENGVYVRMAVIERALDHA
ncbi:Aspartate carbamoyltransferase [Clostridiaceae bacterium JG1575]|nr:Aspartate carbamoyltransferase [Clostridiaceae bacterium JG1575]